MFAKPPSCCCQLTAIRLVGPLTQAQVPSASSKKLQQGRKSQHTHSLGVLGLFLPLSPSKPCAMWVDSGSPCNRATTLKKEAWEAENQHKIEIRFKERFCLSAYGLSKQLLCPHCWPPSQVATLYRRSLLLDRNSCLPCLTARYAKLRLIVPWSQLGMLFPSVSILLPQDFTHCPLKLSSPRYYSILLTHPPFPEMYKEAGIPDAGLKILQDSIFLRI